MHRVDAHHARTFTYALSCITNHAFVGRLHRRRVAQIGEVSHKTRQTQVTPRIGIQRTAHKRIEIGQHCTAHRRWHGSVVAQQHIGLEINTIQLVMHWQRVGARQPCGQQAACAQ